MARGDRFARGRVDTRDGQGHSLPSNRFMRFVAVEFACKPCNRRGVETVLGTWAIETDAPQFDARQVHVRGDNSAVETQGIPEGAAGRRRYRFACPRCGNRPQLREDKIDAALAALYKPGAEATTHRVYI
jgi:hypothetical protein